MAANSSGTISLLTFGAQQTVGAMEVPQDSLVPFVSTTAPATATGSTIATDALTVVRVSPTAAVTGVILEPGQYPGKRISVINEAASANSVTFAASGTSNVAAGTSAVINGQARLDFVWDPGLNPWV